MPIFIVCVCVVGILSICSSYTIPLEIHSSCVGGKNGTKSKEDGCHDGSLKLLNERRLVSLARAR